MAKSNDSKTNDGLLFSGRFFEDHAGHVINDPYLAMIELIANCYDAGATRVDVLSPPEAGQRFEIKDNGTGMTPKQFEERWKTLSYNRLDSQGDLVEFPPGVRVGRRKAFGRSGKGRHGAFCFADKYTVESHRDGHHLRATVTLTRDIRSPFRVVVESLATGPANGTTISGVAQRNAMVESVLRRHLTSKFLVDPSFSIELNGQALELFKLDTLTSEQVVVAPGAALLIHKVDGKGTDYDSRLRGVTWWVNRRMVGEPSWESLDGDTYLDGRSQEAKRYSFVIEADFLKRDIKDDWSGFHGRGLVNASKEAADGYILKQLNELMASQRKERKREALKRHATLLGEMAPISRNAVGRFIDEVQQRCPSLSERDLAKTVEVYAKLEQSKSGFDLLTQLSRCSAEDLDTWNDLMKQWSATNAQIVLGELHRRLKLITELHRLLLAASADELHDIHPLFERGLWIVGPEYEAVDFRSNRGMAEVIRGYFGQAGAAVSRRRPDIVATNNGSVTPYSAPAFDDGQELSGYRTVLVIELKATGVQVTQAELDQARNYCKELRQTGAVQQATRITAYVLGSTLEPGIDELTTMGETQLRPMTYQVFLDRAQTRTFNLQRRIEESTTLTCSDPVVDDVVQQATALPGFQS